MGAHRTDPAYQKLQAMQKVRHHYFRWTPRTAQITFWYVIVIPVVLGTFAYNTQGTIDVRGKRRGDVLTEVRTLRKERKAVN